MCEITDFLSNKAASGVLCSALDTPSDQGQCGVARAVIYIYAVMVVAVNKFHTRRKTGITGRRCYTCYEAYATKEPPLHRLF